MYAGFSALLLVVDLITATAKGTLELVVVSRLQTACCMLASTRTGSCERQGFPRLAALK